MRPTARGLGVLVAAPVLAVVARLFGQPELAVAAVAAAALLLVAVLGAAVVPLRLEVERSPRPARLPAGDPCRVHLRVRNVGTRPSPVATLRDDVGRFGTATLELAPMPRGSTREAAYSLPTSVRGVHPLGPVSATARDPFGLVVVRRELPGRTAVVVLPRTHPLAPLPPARGDERESGVRALATGSTVDEELASLRPYEPGDDVRRIHWRTTARTGEPVVRQFDEPLQRRTTVLLDTRPSAHDDASFERSVSAAASVVALAATRGELVRLVTTGGVDTRLVAAASEGDELLDRLAAVGPDPTGSLPAALALLAAPPRPARLVTCSGSPSPEELRGLVGATRQVSVHVLVLTGGAAAELEDPGPLVVRWTDRPGSDDLTGAWSDAVAPARVAAR